jgi:HAD superfamily hydrolase (TIGR01484 family)
MPDRLLICTDLDRTLIPNGPQPESSGARQHFAMLVARPEVTLAYVSGRDRALVQAALERYQLPLPDFVLGDVGTSIYHLGPVMEWRRQTAWEAEIAQDWNGLTRSDLQQKLLHLPPLQLQEAARQNSYKLSFYLPLQTDRDALAALIEQCLEPLGVRFRLVWSVDEAAGVGLLDVLPARASKYHAIEALMQQQGFSRANTVFCGDSGNDLEVLVSPLAAVLVANSPADVQALARSRAAEAGHADRLYLARGNFMGLNGNYSAGILEGIAHYHPDTIAWMGLAEEASRA